MAKRSADDKQVLYLADIGQLLPLDAERKGRSTPLEWGKLRSPADSSERGVLHNLRVQDLRSRRDGFTWLGVYYELLKVFGFARIAPLRGWLVNHRLSAATTAQVGQAIGCVDLRMLARALRALEDVGLLVRLDRPDLAEAVAKDHTVRVGPPPAPRTLQGQLGTPQHPGPRAPEHRADKPDDGRTDDARKRAEVSAEGEAKVDTPQNRANPTGIGGPGWPVSGQWPAGGHPAAGPPPADVRQETPDGRLPDAQTPTAAAATPPPLSAHGHGETGDRKTAAAAPPPDAPAGDEPTGDGPRQTGSLPTGNAQAPDGTACDHEATGSVQQATSGSPHARPSAEPTQPTEADPGQPGRAPGPGTRAGPDATWHSEAFAQQVVEVLYPSREDLVLQGRRCDPPQDGDEFRRRELGCIARCFERGLHGLGQVETMRLLERSLKEARATHRKKARKTRGRLWVYWFKQHIRGMPSGPP